MCTDWWMMTSFKDTHPELAKITYAVPKEFEEEAAILIAMMQKDIQKHTVSKVRLRNIIEGDFPSMYDFREEGQVAEGKEYAYQWIDDCCDLDCVFRR